MIELFQLIIKLGCLTGHDTRLSVPITLNFAELYFKISNVFVDLLDFGGRPIEKITLDPRGRFPDRNAADNVWPRS